MHVILLGGSAVTSIHTNRKKVLATALAVLAAAGGLCGQATRADAINPPPAWAIVEVPEQYRGYVGKDGLPEPYPSWDHPIGVGTQSIDFWQANHFLVCRPETAKFLYSQYTPTVVEYAKGTLPVFDGLVDRHLHAMICDRDKALVLLREVLPRLLVHPGMAPVGPAIPTDRGLLDEELLESERAYCNEQARVFVRLCQVAGVPARMVFLFYADKKSGHVVAEFYAEGRWSMADASYFTVFPAADGHLMSAAECHGEGRAAAGQAYYRRYQQLIQMSNQELAGAKYADIRDEARRARSTARTAGDIRRSLESQTADSIGKTLWAFGILNYPLPPRPKQ